MSEAKRWLLGGYNHGHLANLPYPIAMEMALGFRFTAERFYEVGFLNRLVDADELMPTRDGDGRASADAAAGLARQHRAHDAPDAPRRRPRAAGRSPPSCTTTATRAT